MNLTTADGTCLDSDGFSICHCFGLVYDDLVLFSARWLRLVLRGTPAEGAAMKIRHSLACRLGIFDLEQLISEENLFVCFALRSLPCIGFDYLNCLTLRSILLPSRFACVCDVEH